MLFTCFLPTPVFCVLVFYTFWKKNIKNVVFSSFFYIIFPKAIHQRTQNFLESPYFHAVPIYLAKFIMSVAE